MCLRLSTQGGPIGRQIAEPSEDRVLEEVLRSFGSCPQRGLWDSSHFLFLSLLPNHEVSSIALHSCHDVLPKQQGQLILDCVMVCVYMSLQSLMW